MSSTPRIALIGGGIGGLVAALALTRRGFNPKVYEQSSEIKEIGRRHSGDAQLHESAPRPRARR
jgi:2-polyprenyl-6-methoxyphenol hydroxylase-like FAD-dependent oxidoreductase